MSKNFLITGAARGIGRGLSRLLLQKGHRVFMLDNNEAELVHLRQQLPKLFPNTSSTSSPPPHSWQIMQGDLCKPEDIQLAAASASTFFDGHLDVLINNAAFTGGVGGSPFAELSLDSWNRSLQTNLTGSMLLSQACLPLLRRKSGGGSSIIMMSSTRAHQSEPNSEGYAATKAGLLGLTHALASSLAEDNVSVNAILPGWINVANECKDADEKGTTWEEGLSEEDHRWHFTGRVGRVEDILRAVEYLVDARDFVSGTEVVVDGGVSRKMVYPE